MTLPWPRRSRRNVRISDPENKLRTLVNQPGGLSREDAIASAEQRIEQMREQILDIITTMIGELCDAMQQRVTPSDIGEIHRILDRIIALSGPFRLRPLAQSAMNLTDLLRAMEDRSCIAIEPIIVHVEAIKLLGPHAVPLSDDGVSDILTGLDDVLRHFHIEVVPNRLDGLL